MPNPNCWLILGKYKTWWLKQKNIRVINVCTVWLICTIDLVTLGDTPWAKQDIVKEKMAKVTYDRERERAKLHTEGQPQDLPLWPGDPTNRSFFWKKETRLKRRLGRGRKRSREGESDWGGEGPLQASKITAGPDIPFTKESRADLHFP